MQAAIISPNSSMDNLFNSDSASNEIIIRDMLCIDIFFLKEKTDVFIKRIPLACG